MGERLLMCLCRNFATQSGAQQVDKACLASSSVWEASPEV
jgi:hypothetical protein